MQQYVGSQVSIPAASTTAVAEYVSVNRLCTTLHEKVGLGIESAYHNLPSHLGVSHRLADHCLSLGVVANGGVRLDVHLDHLRRPASFRIR